MSVLEQRFGAVGRKGSLGEDWMFKKLQSNFIVSDYRKDYVMQTQGIDFGIKKPEWHREFTLDVKTNLYLPDADWYGFKLELESDNKAGWFFTSKADRIYHVNSYLGKYLYYDLNMMRYYVTKKLINNDMKDLEIKNINGDILLQIIIPKGLAHNIPVSQLFS